MKFKIYILCFFLIPGLLSAQKLLIKNTYTKDFPIMKSNIFVIDENGIPYKGLEKEDLIITENGQPMDILSLECPDIGAANNISVVLAMDVSSSMRGEKLNMAKSVAKVFIRSLAEFDFECAITAFNHQSMIIRDFIDDTTQLYAGIDELTSKGGTNFDMAFLQHGTGAIQVARGGYFKKAIILLTDGIAPGDKQEIIDEAIKSNVTIFCVGLDIKIPDILKEISEGTGGDWFEGLKDSINAERVYLSILKELQFNFPCLVSWKSTGCENDKDFQIAYPPAQISDNGSYTAEYEQLSLLEAFANENLRFDNVSPGDTAAIDFTLRALNDTLKISNVSVDNQYFKIEPDIIGLRLEPGEDFHAEIKFIPGNKEGQLCQIDIEGDFCNTVNWTVFGNLQTAKRELEVVFPNGSEKLIAGTDSTFEWFGSVPGEDICLEISLNNGEKWDTLAISDGDKYEKNEKIPWINSDSCLFRVSRPQEGIMPDPYTNEKIISCTWFKNNDMFLIGDSLGYIEAMSNKSGAYIKTYKAHTGRINQIIFTDDARKFITAGDDKKIKVWDAFTFELIEELSGHFAPVKTLSVSSDGKRLISGGKDNMPRIWDLEKASLLRYLSGHEEGINVAEISSDGRYAATGGIEKKLRIWEISKPNSRDTIFSSEIVDLEFIDGSSKILVSTKDSLYLVNTSDLSYEHKEEAGGAVNITMTEDENEFYALVSGIDLAKYDLMTFQHELIYSHTDTNITDISFDYDQGLTLISDTNNYMRIISLPDGDILTELSRNFPPNLLDIDWPYTGRRFLVTTADSVYFFNKNAFRETDLALPNEYGAESVSFIFNSENLLALTNDHRILFIDSADGSITKELSPPKPWDHIAVTDDAGHIIFANKEKLIIKDVSQYYLSDEMSMDDSVTCIIYSPDNKHFALGLRNGRVHLFDAANLTEIDSRRFENPIKKIDFSLTGTQLACLLENNEIKMLDINDFNNANIITADDFEVDDIMMNAEGTLIALKGENKVQVMDTKNFSLNGVYETGGFNIIALTFAGLDENLIAAGENGYLFEWQYAGDLSFTDVSDSLWAIIIPQADTKDLHIGNVYVNSVKDSIFAESIHNTGDVPILIKKVIIKEENENEFTVISFIENVTLNPGDKLPVEISFAPKSPGIKQEELLFVSGYDTLRSNVTGEAVIPAANIITSNISFGQIYIGDTKDTLAIILENISNEGLLIEDAYLDGLNLGEFQLNTNLIDVTISPGDTLRAELSFIPGSIGSKFAELAIIYDNGQKSASIGLSGTGIEDDVLKIITQNLNFGSVEKGSTKDSILTDAIENTGELSLLIDSVAISGINKDHFEFIGISVSYLDPGASADLQFRFAPMAEGLLEGNAFIYYNSKTDPAVVSLTGTGTNKGEPEITATGGDFGKLLCESDTTLIINVTNTGSAPLDITSISVVGEFKDYFDILNDNELGILEPDSTFELRVEYAPAENGRHMVELKFDYDHENSGPYYYLLWWDKESSGLKLSHNDIEFQDIMPYTEYDTSFTLENTGSTFFSLILPMVSGEFVIESATQVMVPSGTSSELTVKFTGAEPGIYSGTFTFKDFCDNEYSVDLIANVLPQDSADIELEIGRISTKTGEDIILPIYMNRADKIKESGLEYVDADIVMNASLFYPSDSEKGSVIDGMRYLPVRLDVTRPTGIIFEIAGLTMLGNDSATTIYFENIRPSVGNSKINDIDGRLLLTDICREGGVRLIGYKEWQLETITQTDNKLTINYSIHANTHYTISLVNIYGKICHLGSYRGRDSGTYAEDINISELSSGVYFVIIETGYDIRSHKVLITK